MCLMGFLVLIAGCKPKAPTPAAATGTDKLCLAAETGDIAAMAKLLEEGVPVDQANKVGNCPLGSAAANGQLDAVKFLLDHGANINAANESGKTALELAVSSNGIPVTKALLERGADLNADKKKAVLEDPIADGHLEMVRLLIAHGANVNSAKYSLLGVAAEHGRADVTIALIDAGANIEGLSAYGATPLLDAAGQHNWECSRILVEAGANVNVSVPGDKRMPLHIAVLTANLEMAQLLLAHGARRDVKDINGWTPLDIAKRRPGGSSKEMLDLLQAPDSATQRN